MMTEESVATRITPLTLFRFLIGDSEAIIACASTRMTMLVGALLVFTAALAREYDGESFLHDPIHLVRPLIASLVTGTAVLFAIMLCSKWLEVPGERPPFVKTWASFMGVYWLTAPMAWLYAIPYESWTEPTVAVESNFWTLAFVATWRVILITRVLSVLLGVGWRSVFAVVLLVADAIALLVVTLVPKPVFGIMGGIRALEGDAVVASISFMIGTLGVLISPVLIIGAALAAYHIRPTWEGLQTPKASVSRNVWVLIVIVFAAFVPLLIVHQPKQINRALVENHLREGEFAAAFALADEHDRAEFPPHWNPPPRMGYRNQTPELEDVRDWMIEAMPRNHLAELYIKKVRLQFRYQSFAWDFGAAWTDFLVELDSDEAGHSRAFHGEEAIELRPLLVFLLRCDFTATDEDRAMLQRLLDLTDARITEHNAANEKGDPSEDESP